MGAIRKSHTYQDDVNGKTIIEIWHVDGIPEVAEADGACPQGYDAQAVHADCHVVHRDFEYLGQATGKSKATIRYSNDQREIQEPDGDAVLIHDMIGHTERLLWDLDNPADGIGPNGEGVDVYVPFLELIYEHLESVFDEDAVGDLTGFVNDAVWKGRAKDTTLFIGARARQNEPGKVRVEYHFIYHPITVAAPNGMKTMLWKPFKKVPGGPDGDGMTWVDYEWSTVIHQPTVHQEGDFTRLPI